MSFVLLSCLSKITKTRKKSNKENLSPNSKSDTQKRRKQKAKIRWEKNRTPPSYPSSQTLSNKPFKKKRKKMNGRCRRNHYKITHCNPAAEDTGFGALMERASISLDRAVLAEQDKKFHEITPNLGFKKCQI